MNENLRMVRGDTFSFTIEIQGLTSDLTEAYLSCKKDKDSNIYTFQKSLGDGIEKVSETDNSKSYQVTIEPEDTNEIDAGNYYYDLQLEIDGDVFTPLIGVLNIIMDITTVPVTPTPSL